LLSNSSNPLTFSGSIASSGASYNISLQHSPDADNAFKIPQSIQIGQGGLNYVINGQVYSKPAHLASNVLMEKIQMVREQANQYAAHSAQSGSLTNLSTLSPSQVIQLLSSGGNQVQSLGSNLYEVRCQFDPFQTGTSIEFRSIFNASTGQFERSSVYEGGVMREETLFETTSDGKKMMHSKLHSADTRHSGQKVIISRQIGK